MFSTRLDDQERYNSDFLLHSMSRQHLTLEEFATNFEQRGYSNPIRHAAFLTFDTDGQQRISQYEYILCRAAFDFVPERDRGTAIVRYRLMIIFNLYDKSGNGNLEWSELREMISDLAAGDSHISRLMKNLGIGSSASVSMDKFLAGVDGGHFDKHFLHTRDVFEMHSKINEKSGRVILDPRAVVSGYLPKPLSIADKVRRPADYSSVVVDSTPEAFSRGLHWACIDPALTTSSDWRGALTPPRDTIEFNVASSVVYNALSLLREHVHKNATGTHDVSEDISDSSWLINGIALASLLGSTDVAQQLNTLKILCDECRRIVSQQPMMVEVSAPAKVFGDIHGQLRDLLLMFGEFGFPCHRGGDVETVTYVFNGDFVDRGAHQIEVVLFNVFP